MQLDIKFTESAITHLENAIKGTDKKILLTIKDSGCSGYAYFVDLIDNIDEDCHTIAIAEKVTVLIPKDVYNKAFIGMKVDYVTEGLNRMLKFVNPNTTNECGCGESFQLKKENND